MKRTNKVDGITVNEMKDKQVEALNPNRLVWHNMEVNKLARALRNCQKPAVIWFTGLSGSGKSTIGDALEKLLFLMGYNTYLLDGDNVRHGLCKDLGFSDADRAENIRRVGEVVKLLVDAGQLVLASFISPFQSDRDKVRKMMEKTEFIEIYVKTRLHICEKRDPKGIYKKARDGTIKNFTGIDSPYEIPVEPEITIDTEEVSVEEVVTYLVKRLSDLGVLKR